MTEPGQVGQEVVGVCFHGVGTPGAELEPGAAQYFVGRDLFLTLLDDVMDDPNVEVTFDDGYASDVEIALPALLERDISARFFPLAGRLGTPGHVDEAGVQALVAAGMTVGSHGMNHRSWRGLDAESAREELDTARSVIAAAASAPVTSVACPFGAYDRGALQSLRRHGYAQVFTSDRRRARVGDWLQPRYSVLSSDTMTSVRDNILAPPGRRQRMRGAAVGRLKAWR